MADQSVIWSTYAFEGKLINVRIDTVELPNGNRREREIVEHPGAVAVVPVLDDGRIALVRQYRPAVGRGMLELPAGTVEPGENATSTAQRELEEETGLRAGSMARLVQFFTSPGWCNEELVLFVATNISHGQRSPEDDEDIDVELVARGDIPRLFREGMVADAKTMVGLSIYLGLSLSPEQGGE
ncbi:MAG: NUDIX hydrolase [Thermomicrobiaceae bacterium]